MAPQKKKISAPVAVVPEPIPVYIPRTPVSEEYRKELYEEASRYWYEQADYYGADGDRPWHVQKRLQAILGAVDLETAQAAVAKAKDVCFIHLLAEWEKKNISGPDRSSNWEKIGKKALNTAKMLESKGDLKGAESQKKRAEQCFLRAQALVEEKS